MVTVDLEENWMKETLHDEFKTDAYSCSFHVLEAMRKLGSDSSTITTVSCSTYDAECSEKLRQACSTRYVNTVIRLADEKDGIFTDAAVVHFLGDVAKWRGASYYTL